MFAVAGKLLRYRELLLNLTLRELKARYRGSALGYFWSLANPLLRLGVYTLAFGVILRARWEGFEPYSVFLICGYFPWVWIAASLMEGATSLVANAGLIRKAAFPAEILPMVSVLSNLAHFILAVPIIAAALLISYLLGYQVGGWPAVLFPVVVLLQVPLVSGLALGLSALNVHFKDVRDLLDNLLNLFFFLTPIIYPLDALKELPAIWWAVKMNPFTPFSLAYQQVLFKGVVPDLSLWLQMAFVSLLGWVLGAWLFARLSDSLVEAV